MRCTWDRQPAVVLWETQRRTSVPLCPLCYADWALRARKTPQTEEVLGYRTITHLSQVGRWAA
jgi:hypothetical protein